MDSLEFQIALSNGVANDVFKFSMIRTFDGVSYLTPPLLLPGITNISPGLIPGPATIVLSLYFTPLCVLGGIYMKNYNPMPLTLPFT